MRAERLRFRMTAVPGGELCEVSALRVRRIDRTRNGLRDCAIAFSGPWDENLDVLVQLQRKNVLNDPGGRLADYALSGDGKEPVAGRGFVSRFEPVFGDGPPRFRAVFEVSGAPASGAF